jgi:uncharacterized membrane protein
LSWTTFGLLLSIQFVLAAGDVLAKRQNVVWALLFWFVGCLLWIPTFRAPGFTRLIGAADALGLVVIVLAGRIFLHEVLSVREWVGIGLALAALVMMWKP